jgi:hypothetical protein
MFLQRYDTTGFKGWGSAKDMIPWDLGDWEWELGVRLEREARTGEA